MKKECKKCRKVFKTYPSRVRLGRGLFCSVNCHNIFQKGKKPWNTGKRSFKLSLAKRGAKNPMWKGGVSKREQDKKYSLTERGKEVRNKARKKYRDKPENKLKHLILQKNRLKNNIHYKIRRRMSSAIWCKLVRYRGLKKNGKIADFLPYSINELKNHLEEMFLPGMTWSNYGEWHIDHKIPDYSFIYSSMADNGFKESWSLQNLQPMWGVDNLKKGKKL